MCACVYRCINISFWIRVCMCVFMCVNVCMYACKCMRVCMHVRVYVCVCMCVFMCVHVFMHVCICVCTFWCEDSNMHRRVKCPHFDAAIRLTRVVDKSTNSACAKRNITGGIDNRKVYKGREIKDGRGWVVNTVIGVNKRKHITIQHSTVQHSTVQHGTAQHRTSTELFIHIVIQIVFHFHLRWRIFITRFWKGRPSGWFPYTPLLVVVSNYFHQTVLHLKL